MPGAVVEACGPRCVAAIHDGSGAYTVRHLPDGSYTLTPLPDGERTSWLSGRPWSSAAEPSPVRRTSWRRAGHAAGGHRRLPPLGNPLQPAVLQLRAVHVDARRLRRRVSELHHRAGHHHPQRLHDRGPSWHVHAVVAPLAALIPARRSCVITIDLSQRHPNDVLNSAYIYIDPSGFVRDVDGNPIVGRDGDAVPRGQLLRPFIPA